ncbi:MAG TPA: glycosyltransferase family 4 protein, partial [Casimicrobiaceae bacterium]|nr:glycosyltransferase family 4 protein [Casimicrobiaceae bacterium]
EALARYQPALVQIEHAELAGLIEQRTGTARWVLGLHDAVSASDFDDARQADEFQDLVSRYDAVTVCSSEDARLVDHPRVVCVPNGTAFALQAYRPSQGATMLFVGPFRYQPNLDGVREFLRVAYPAIREAVPDARLMVLGGDDAPRRVATEPMFHQDGVQVLGHRDDVEQLLHDCALSINPLAGIRGSAIKLIESLTTGRVCVSTLDGARGFADEGLDALATVPDVASMAGPIVSLLSDTPSRHRREAPRREVLDRYQWPQCAGVQLALWQSLL